MSIISERNEEFIMRSEAQTENWKKLYEIASEIKEKNPWDYFWDMDLIYLKDEDVYVSILGRGGETYGISVYEGELGLNDFKILSIQNELNISPEFAMYLQNNLTCYWGNREELSAKQRNIAKELGYTYRGKNQWLYFMSFEKGYMPYNFDAEEVTKMTSYLSSLHCALKAYLTKQPKTNFEQGYILSYCGTHNDFSLIKCDWEDVGFHTYDLANDKELVKELKSIPKTLGTIEIEVLPMFSAMNDKAFDKPINPAMCMITEAKSGMVLAAEFSTPKASALIQLTNTFINTVFKRGLPRKIYVCNGIVATCLDDICRILNIKLELKPFLPAINEAMNSFRRFMR